MLKIFANSVAPVAWNGNQFSLRKGNNSRLKNFKKRIMGIICKWYIAYMLEFPCTYEWL